MTDGKAWLWNPDSLYPVRVLIGGMILPVTAGVCLTQKAERLSEGGVPVNFEIPAFILSLLCLIYSLTAKRRQYHLQRGLKTNLLNQHFMFLVLLVCNILSAVSSVGGVHLQRFASQEVVVWQYFLHACYFLFHTTLSVSFALYIMNVNGASMGRSPRFYFLFALPYLCSELLVLTNSFTGFAFYMDEQFIYHRGPLMPFLYANGAVYLVLGFAFFFRYKQAVSRADSLAIGAVIVLTSLGVALQGIKPAWQVELFSESLTFLGLMIMLEERSGHIDPVTGVLNRIAFADSNRRMMETGQRYRIILVKLADLELISKLFYGREMDFLLIQISAWLTSLSSERDLFTFRYGEFAILCPDTSDREAGAVADAVLNRFGEDWKAGSMPLRLETAVCIVRVPEDVSSLDDLQELLAAGYQKAGPGSRLVPFAELSAHRRNRRIEQALRDAVDGHRLQMWYQPIWSVEKRRTVAAEALLRIDSEELRGLSPEEYIPIAEQCGLIREIGLFAFEDVCRFLRDRQADAPELAYIELNLSVHQFMYDDLVKRFEEIRVQYGVPREALNLEITETASTVETPAVGQAMEALRVMGYTFSLDDFGTGYSNLVQLISSSYKNVKMDKSLLWGAERSETTARLLDSLIHVIRSLGYNVIQEGVETPAQLERTAASGGNLIQGYYFSRPLPENDFLAYLAKEAA